MKEIIIDILAWMIGILILTVEIIAGLSLVFVAFAPSEEEVQCTSITDAKWSGNACYKNGIRIKFNDEQE